MKFPRLAQEAIQEIFLLVSALQLERTALWRGIASVESHGIQPLEPTVKTAKSYSEQLLIDLGVLNTTGRLPNGPDPFQLWLDNAILLTRPRPESQRLEQHRRSISSEDDPWSPLAGTPALAGQAGDAKSPSLGSLPARPGSDEHVDVEWQALVKRRLPRLLAALDLHPRPLLVRAGVPGAALREGTPLDQWTYVCESLGALGTPGIVHTLRLIREAQETAFSEALSKFGIEFVSAVLRARGPEGGGSPSDLIPELRRTAAEEAYRWQQIQRYVDHMDMKSDSRAYVSQVTRVWSLIARSLSPAVPVPWEANETKPDATGSDEDVPGAGVSDRGAEARALDRGADTTAHAEP